MSFYVTLPSDTKNGIPGQPQNNYTTFMNPPIMLPSKYEVALTEFVYSNKFDADIGTASIIRTAMFSQDQRHIKTSIKLPEDYTSHILAFYINARFKTELYLDFRKECISLSKDMSINANIAKYYYNNYKEKLNAHVIFYWSNGKYTILSNEATLTGQLAATKTFDQFDVQWSKQTHSNPYVSNSAQEDIYIINCTHRSSTDKSKSEWENIGYGEIT